MHSTQILSMLCAAATGVSASAFFLTAYNDAGDVGPPGEGQFFFNNLTAYQSTLIINNRTTAPHGPATVFNSTDLPAGITAGGHIFMVRLGSQKLRVRSEADLQQDVSVAGGQQVYVQPDGKASSEEPKGNRCGRVHLILTCQTFPR